MTNTLLLRSRWLMGVSALAIMAIPQLALAQQSSAGNVIEELVITAEKREQSLQDVAVAVSAYTAAKRDLIGINSIQDMTNFTPGLQYNSSTDRVSLRGVGRLTNVLSADAAVANYSDGVFETFAVRAGSSTLYIDRVEVLRGPQGTLYGRNSIGGALNIISKRPTQDLGGEVRAGYDSYGATALEATYNIPLNEKIAIKVSGNWFNQKRGWIDNLVPGMPDEGNVRNEWTTEFQAKIEFNDKFETWLKVIGTQWRNGGGGPGAASGGWTPSEWPTYYSPPAASQPSQGFGCYTGPIATGVTNVVNLNPGGCKNPAVNSPWTIARQSAYKVTLPVATTVASEWIYHADNFDVKYLTGGVHYHYILKGTTDTPRAAPIASYTLPALGARGPLVINPSETFDYQEDNAFWSHEINLISTGDSALQWVAGAYYFSQHYTQPVYTENPRQPQWNGPFAFEFLCAQTGGVCPKATGFRRFDNRPDVRSKSSAVFGQIDWKFTDTLKTTLGLRYSTDTKEGSESVRITCFAVTGCDFSSAFGVPPIIDLTQLAGVVSSGAVLLPGVVGKTTYDPATGFATRRQKATWDAVSGTAGLEWTPDSDTLLYGKYSRGYKAGGFNIGIFTVLSHFPTTDKESVDSFEIGLKKDFGRTFRTNMAVFHYAYKNLQIPITRVSTGAVPAFGPGPTTATDFYNVPEAISQGFELESTWQPIDNLQLLFNYSFNNTQIQAGTAVDSVDPAGLQAGARPVGTNGPVDIFTGLPTRTQSLSGNSLPNAARNKVAFNANYAWQFETGSLTGSLSYFWRDKQYGTVFQRSYTEAPAWDQIDMRFTWSDAKGRYKIIAYGKNLADTIGFDAGATGTREAGLIKGITGTETLVIQGISKTFSVVPPRTFGVELQYKF